MPGRKAAGEAPPHVQLLSLAVHEFRTPAAVLSGYLRMLQRDAATLLDDKHRHMVEEAEKSCARLVALVGEVNELARLDDPAVELPADSIDLWSLLRDVTAELPAVSARGPRVTTQGLTGKVPIRGDAVRLHAAFGTLIRAALREHAEDARLVVAGRTQRKGKRTTALVILAAEDEIARTAAAPEAPFDEWRGGLGLALPIARRVIERHGGRVWSPRAEKAAYGSRRATLVRVPI